MPMLQPVSFASFALFSDKAAQVIKNFNETSCFELVVQNMPAPGYPGVQEEQTNFGLSALYWIYPFVCLFSAA